VPRKVAGSARKADGVRPKGTRAPRAPETTDAPRPAPAPDTTTDPHAAPDPPATLSADAPRAARSSHAPHASRDSRATPARRATHEGPRYFFFGGKGGTGKTTSAAAAALRLLDAAGAGEQILLFSTDPAHSLSDSLDAEVGDRLVEVARSGGSRLVAYEMDAPAALEKFRAEHRATLAEIAERGTLLDEGDIDELLSLSLPGMDEVMALFELSELDRAGRYAAVVVDTAPSGHTSRLLRLPQVFSHMVAALDRMNEKHRYIVAHFARGARPRADRVEPFLDDLAERIGRVRAMLYDASRTSFTLVTIPEALAVEETARYYDLLGREGVPVTGLVVNRVERVRPGCAYCRARAESQRPWLERIARDFKQLRPRAVPLLDGEVRGLDALRNFSSLSSDLAASGARKTRHSARSGATARTPAGASDDTGGTFGDGERALFDDEEGGLLDGGAGGRGGDFALEARRLLIFGGKGGVGKTTAAASAALALADEAARARVLVFSTDPAHSLSDSFGETVGELRRGVAGRANLDAMEIDPGARFEELKARFRAWTDELFASLTGGSGWEVRFDREAMRELVELAPPGVDEIAALSAVADLLEEGRYTSIVLDTAPTGHLVRFLELPGVALAWVRTFIKLLLKYRNVVRASGVAEELIALSKSIKRVAALLTDARACEFVGVAIPERMSLEETARLSDSLARLGVPMRRLLVNSFVPSRAAAACEFCRARRAAQEGVLAEFRRRFGGPVELYAAPQQPREVRGPERLGTHFACWRKLGASRMPKRRAGVGAGRGLKTDEGHAAKQDAVETAKQDAVETAKRGADEGAKRGARKHASKRNSARPAAPRGREAKRG
jgi:arsenite/tail-anchored protein-transporting ATPase